jgi:hypothetical protein
MGRRTDLAGLRFERLLVLRYSHSASNHAWWLCACDCGNETVADGSMLRDGRWKSCGCLKREQIIARSTKHGHKSRAGASHAWNSWMNMTRRCTNPEHPRYPDWGGRGITICEQWQDFRNFLADMGEPPPGMTLDRRDNNGNYTPENCRWATSHEQKVNSRNFKLTPDVIAEAGRLRVTGLSMAVIGTQLGLNRHTVSRALSGKSRSRTKA